MASAAMPPDASSETRTLTDWGALFLVFAVLALNSHSRAAEIPLILLALWAPRLLWQRGSELLKQPAMTQILALFACYWLPMLLALPDAVDFSKSLQQSLAALRFPLAALTCLCLLHRSWQLLLLFRGVAFLVLFWALDAVLQQVLGRDLFGLPDVYPRLSGIFAADYLRLGLYSALLLPFVLYQFSHPPQWFSIRTKPKLFWFVSWGLALIFILAVIWLSGTRSGWIMAALALLVWAAALLRSLLRRWGRARVLAMLLGIGAIGGAALIWSYQHIPSVQARVQQTALVFTGDEAAIDEALSFRLPIWRQAWAIAREHPLNGVGPRGFRQAYAERAGDQDFFMSKEGMGASHAHQLQLAIWTETGLIGLLAFCFGVWMFWRNWRQAKQWCHSRCLLAAPALSLLLVVFPLNSHLDAYASNAALMFWCLLIIYFTAWQSCVATPTGVKPSSLH